MTRVTVDGPVVAAPPPAHGERFALRVMQIGAIAVVLAVTTLNVFELDRFFVPKELALNLTALLAGFVAAAAMKNSAATRIDLFLAGYLLLSAISAVFATNHWVALRALAISTSAAVLFWTARAIRNAGFERPLLNGLALAVVIAAITSLLQTYGLDITLFSENRVPGGTLGNRNFIAHVAAFGSPLLLLAALRAQTRRMYLSSSIGWMLVVATLVLTRSRAAWLAFAAVMLVFLGGLLLTVPRMLGRFGGSIVIAAAGVAAALALPNALKWRSDNPYLESVKRVADYERGSGRGRLVQYQQSLLMAARHPLFGVGPGNWPVEYPAHAARNDPSLNDSEPGTTLNPWPSSDWIAWISERGPAGTVLLALVFIGIAFSVRDPEDPLRKPALLAILAGAIIAGMFDAVLLTAVPAFIVWSAAGALYAPRHPEPQRRRGIWAGVILATLISGIGAFRSATQIISMNAYAGGTSLESASAIDPGNYRLQLRLARGGKHRCEHARAAHALLPYAHAAEEASRGCR